MVEALARKEYAGEQRVCFLDKMSPEELDEASRSLDERSEPSRLGPQLHSGQ